MDVSEKLKKLPPYLFAELDKKKEEVKKRGIDVINLGIGDPDLPTSKEIIEALYRAALDPSNHRYPSYEGMFILREKFAEWFKRRFGVTLNPENEVITLIGSKEGIAHLPLGVINKEEYVLIPDPGYPVYYASTIFADGVPYFMPLLKTNNFLPDLSSIPGEVVKRTKLMFINYPNNPTSATAPLSFLKEVVQFALKHGIIIASDAAYSEIFWNEKPHSILEVEGAMECAIEFHSLSKTFNMTGWRIGFAVGNRKIVNALLKVKTNVDSGVFQAVQYAGIKALEIYDKVSQQNREVYKKRREIFLKGIEKLGLNAHPSDATFYVWMECPENMSSMEMAERCLEKGVVITPGIGFGKYGEGFIRVALTVSEEKIEEACKRIGEAFKN
jgi:LL-diaminopimelate aminotransferase